MRVKVLFFGMLKDIVGSAEEQLNVPEDAQLENIFDHYAECFPRLREMAGSIVLARNHEFSKASERVTDGDEVAFLPPVSGGSAAAGLPYTHEIQDAAGHFFALTRQPIDTHAIGRMAMVHRLGRMEIGETSVAVIVTAPHRQAAFDAALEGINRLKRLVPIWKKEYFVDGEVWVEGEWDRSAPLASHP